MADLPNGLDRADGQSGRPGTATPSANLVVSSSAGAGAYSIEETPDSPEIERAEQATIRKTFTMSWDEATTRIQFYGRGTMLVDSFGNVTRVLSSKIHHQKGDYAILEIVAESLSFDSPPDTFQITPIELNINIIKHPRYLYAFLGDNDTEEQLNQAVIRALQNYFENVTAAYRDALTSQLKYSMGNDGTLSSGGVAVPDASFNPHDDDTDAPNTLVSPIPGTDLAKSAAIEIIQKYWRGEETPYVVGYQIVWSSYYFRPQYLNPGGYVEDPITESNPQLPNYFWSPDFPPTTNTIFDQLSTFNPQSYSATGAQGGQVVLSWLRKADTMDEQRTWFRVDRTWIGSPVGFWDPQLYNSDNRPTSPADYLGYSMPKVTKDILSFLRLFVPIP